MNFFETFWKPYFCKIVTIEFFNFSPINLLLASSFKLKYIHDVHYLL